MNRIQEEVLTENTAARRYTEKYKFKKNFTTNNSNMHERDAGSDIPYLLLNTPLISLSSFLLSTFYFLPPWFVVKFLQKSYSAGIYSAKSDNIIGLGELFSPSTLDNSSISSRPRLLSFTGTCTIILM